MKPIWEQQFVGLSHYEFALVKDKLVLESLWRTIVFSAELVIISTVLGLIVAVLIRNHRRAQPTLRLAYFLPYIVPAVVSGLLMRVLFQPQFGSVNRAAEHHWPAIATLDGKPQERAADGGAGGGVGAAGVQRYSVPCRPGPDTLGFARRGAGLTARGAWQTFWRITFPLLMPVMLFVVVTGNDCRLTGVWRDLRHDAGIDGGGGAARCGRRPCSRSCSI